MAEGHEHLNFPMDSLRDLHPSGIEQIKQMSSLIKVRYADILHEDYYFVRSTDTQRTIDTAKVQAQSLFEKEPEMKVDPILEDYTLHLDKKNCKLLKKMVNHAKNSEH